MKPGAPWLRSIRLLDQVRERIRHLHYSLKTEKAYLCWVPLFIRWSAIQSAGMRHPRDRAAKEAEAFLSMLANQRKVSAFTHNQALSTVLFRMRLMEGLRLRIKGVDFDCPTSASRQVRWQPELRRQFDLLAIAHSR